MLSLNELSRIARLLNGRVLGHRIDKLVQADESRLQLSLYGPAPDGGGAQKCHLVFCCAPGFGRVSELARKEKAPPGVPRFVQYLKPRLLGAKLVEVALHPEERQLSLGFEASEGRFELLLSLMGNRSNLYLLDAERCVLACQRPLDKTRRTLSIGEPWHDPPRRDDAAEEPLGEDRFSAVADDAYLAEIERHYEERESRQRGESRSQKVNQVLRKELKLAKRRLERIESELAEANDASRLQREGELLKGSLAQVPAKTGEFVARDYATGEEVRIGLDPALSPQENLQALFKRYQKLVRRLQKAGGQVDAARERVVLLESLAATNAELSPDEPDFETFEKRPEIRALLRKHARPKPSPAAPSEEPKLPAALRGVARRLLPRRYRSLDGLEIWVGRSDEGNDHLSTRLARGNDLFFHLDGAPGSHVVLRTQGRGDPPSDSLLDAAELAVHFSKARNATRADVHIVAIKQVRKPKGAKRGLVVVTGGKSLDLRREPARLKRVLDARIEDPGS